MPASLDPASRPSRLPRSELIISRFSLFWLSKAHSWTTPVLVDEFDASLLEGPLYDQVSRGAAYLPSFELVDSHDTNACSIRQVLLAPLSKPASGPALGGSDHPLFIVTWRLMLQLPQNYWLTR